MIQKTYTMKWELGLHARPSAKIIEKITDFNLDMAKLIYGGLEVRLKSIMELLTSSISPGDQFKLLLDGPDEQKAFEFLDKAFTSPEEEALYD